MSSGSRVYVQLAVYCREVETEGRNKAERPRREEDSGETEGRYREEIHGKIDGRKETEGGT